MRPNYEVVRMILVTSDLLKIKRQAGKMKIVPSMTGDLDGTGGTVPPNLRLGDGPCIRPPKLGAKSPPMVPRLKSKC